MWLRAGISWTFTTLTCHRLKYLEVAVTPPGTIVLASNVTAKAINNVHGNVSWIYKDHWLKKSIAEFFLVYKPWHLNCNIPYISTSGFCHGTNQVSFPLCWNQTLSIYFTNHFCSTRASWYHDLSISSLSIPPFVRFTEVSKVSNYDFQWFSFETRTITRMMDSCWIPVISSFFSKCFLFHVTYLLNTLKLLRKHSFFSSGCVFSGHFSKHTLVTGSLATLQAKQSEGRKSFAPAFLQPKQRQALIRQWKKS